MRFVSLVLLPEFILAACTSTASPTRSVADVSPSPLGAGSPGASVGSPAPSITASLEPSPSSASPDAEALAPGSWELDPAFPAPTSASTQLHVLVWYQGCAGMQRPEHGMADPIVDFAVSTVTITILGVPPPGANMTCPLPPGTRRCL